MKSTQKKLKQLTHGFKKLFKRFIFIRYSDRKTKSSSSKIERGDDNPEKINESDTNLFLEVPFFPFFLLFIFVFKTLFFFSFENPQQKKKQKIQPTPKPTEEYQSVWKETDCKVGRSLIFLFLYFFLPFLDMQTRS